MSWLWELIRQIIAWLTGEVEAVKLAKRACMPLFYTDLNGKLAATWDYTAKSEAERKHCREYIRNLTTDDEQPAILFLICNVSPEVIADAARECCEDEIAVFGTLYVDDPDSARPKLPRWWEIEDHVETWKAVHKKAGKYFTGLILSIETNEQAESATHIAGCISVMRDVFPGAQYYGTHLEFNGASQASSYRWTGGDSTPSNVNVIIVELCDPAKGDAIGLNGIKNIYNKLAAAEKKPFAAQEYSLHPGGMIYIQQHEWLRSQKPWGAG